MASRSVALLLASRFLGDLGSDDVWAASVLSDGLEPTPDGEHEQLVVVELRRLSDGAAGYATLTGAAPGDVAQEAFVEQLHGVVLENSQGAALPACRGHPHPRRPRVEGGILSWHCPVALGLMRSTGEPD